jgi:phosphoesterase RecJ-like protein
MARATEACTLAHDGRLAYVVLEPAMLRGLDVDREVYREVISHLLSIEGVLVAATFKVEGSGRTTVRMSLRSKSAVEVVEIAKAYGGGGHAHACGAHAVKVKPMELVAEVVLAVGALLPQAAASSAADDDRDATRVSAE